MEYNETNIELLLPRYCEGIATVEEQRLVKDWMKESEENRRIVKQMEILYLAADTVHVINNVNTEKALVKVKGKKTERRKVAWWEWAQRVAAVLFLPLLATFLVEHYGGKSEKFCFRTPVPQHPVSPCLRMVRLVDDDQFRFFHHIIVMPCEPLYGHHPDAPVSQTCPVFCNGLFNLRHKLPAVCDDPDRPLSISEETAYHRRQYMGLAGTCGHLHHHAAMR